MTAQSADGRATARIEALVAQHPLYPPTHDGAVR